ncbi:MAG: hypothetical protein KKD17_02670 [Nanoarchaeota archaeon]|nr:hypothetical protein [Nanoarchaeota archaeon]
MPDTKKDQLTRIFQGLRKVGDVVGSAVISTDCFHITSDSGQGVDDKTFAAMQGGGGQAILACVTRPDVKRGLVLIEMKKAGTIIEKEVR